MRSTGTAAARLQRLQEFTAALSDALTVDDVAQVVLQGVARLPGVVRGGLALIAAGGRELHFVAMHEDALEEERVPWCRLDITADLPIAHSCRTGEALEFATLDDLGRAYPGLAEQQATFGTHAVTTVPLTAGGERLGALMLSYAGEGPFDDTERAFLAAFVEQAAHGLRRARAYEHQHDTAELLQRSLLPQTLPDLPGLALGAQYEAAAHGVEVGGDWFDVLPLQDGRVVVTLGDVMGRGIPAATVMGQIRAALRAYALLDPSPELVLSRLDALLATLGVPEQIITVAYGVVAGDRTSMRLGCAGHLPPLVAHPGEPPAYVEVPTGPPLGLAVEPRSSIVVPLRPGSAVVLFTDGLVESATLPVDDGMALLRDIVARLEPALAHPRELCAQLVARLAAVDAGSTAADDRAVLVLASTVGRRIRTDHIVLPADPVAAGEGRRWLSSVLRGWAVPAELSDDAALCLSEVVTNAVIHTGTAARASVLLDERRLLVTVSDSGRRGAARVLEPDIDDMGGRGLALVQALSTVWSAERRSDGTTVWFELDLARSGGERLAASQS
jgi:serine phosphatase RsbU (regulator of sigma subunit)/anti-sigma regulatory factor (Ser/Thr protein kinase)